MERQQFQKLAEVTVRNLLEDINISENGSNLPSKEVDASFHQQPREIAEPILKKRKFSLKDHMACAEISAEEKDEINRYKLMHIREIRLIWMTLLLIYFPLFIFGTCAVVHILIFTALL